MSQRKVLEKAFKAGMAYEKYRHDNAVDHPFIHTKKEPDFLEWLYRYEESQ